MTDGMRALTLWQPWASLCAAGVKEHETRSWPAPRRAVGERLAIHAAAKTASSVESEITPDLDVLCRSLFGSDWRRSLPRSQVLCTATLHEAVPTESIADLVTDADRTSGIWTPGRWAWPLTDLETFAPIPARGAQGLWRWRP